MFLRPGSCNAISSVTCTLTLIISVASTFQISWLSMCHLHQPYCSRVSGRKAAPFCLPRTCTQEILSASFIPFGRPETVHSVSDAGYPQISSSDPISVFNNNILLAIVKKRERLIKNNCNIQMPLKNPGSDSAFPSISFLPM